MTNGIKLTRDLAAELKEAGLTDVAIHVDLTQERKGYGTEESLNAIRMEYIERVRGLGLHVIFNTTVFDGNFAEIPALIRFFSRHADVVGLVSFQIQAATGRGVLTEKTSDITLPNVRRRIEEACGTPLGWDNIRVGHPDCNSVSYVLLAKDRFLDLNADPELFAAIIRETTDLRYSRLNAFATSARVFAWALSRPAFVLLILRRLAAFAVRHAKALWTGRGEIRKLTLVVHNFMDASELDPERVAACSFMVATDRGFVSMCAHNAAREAFIRKPLAITTAEGTKVWDPLTGKILPTLAREVPAARILPSALSEIPVPRLPVFAGGK
jgi:uncharacterized radical SAM superfamily Fe-S cluster-containing enzyme